MDSGLSKQERICSLKAIEKLIAKGRYVNCGAVRCCYLIRENEGLGAGVQEQGDGLGTAGSHSGVAEQRDGVGNVNRMMVSVPKKLFKRAVKRNLLKRRMRESYRLQKHLLEGCERIDMIFIYNCKELVPYCEIYACIGNILERIAKTQKHDGKL